MASSEDRTTLEDGCIEHRKVSIRGISMQKHVQYATRRHGNQTPATTRHKDVDCLNLFFNKSRDKTSKPLTCRAQTANTATRGRQPWMQGSRQQQRRIMTGSAFCCNATPRIHLYRVYWVMNSSSSSFRREDVRSASTVAGKHLKCWKLKEVKRC